MFNLKNFPHGRDLWSSAPVVAILAVSAIFLTSSTVRIVMKENEIRDERSQLEWKIGKLKAENKLMEESLVALESQEAVERMAKEKLNLKNSGEEVVVIAPPAAPAPAGGGRDNFFVRLVSDWILRLVYFFRR